jgi:uncharacterized membrane protein YccC
MKIIAAIFLLCFAAGYLVRDKSYWLALLIAVAIALFCAGCSTDHNWIELGR